MQSPSQPASLGGGRIASSPQRRAPQRITGSAQRLEPSVGWSIAACCAWLAVFGIADVPVLWLSALFAALVGVWAKFRPARRQFDLALRAIALLAGAYVLHLLISGTDTGASSNLVLGWLGVVCLFYAFLLQPAWAAGVTALAVVEFAAFAVQSGMDPAPADLAAQAGYLCIFPSLLAMKFGAAMRRPEQVLESERIDAGTGLYNMAGFMAHGNEMLARAHRDKRLLSVAVFDCSDLVEVRDIYGSRTARKLMAGLVGKLTRLTAGRGLAARTGPTEFTVVVWGGREKALARIERVLGNPMRIELDAGDSEIVLVPWFQAEAAGLGVGCVEELYQDLRRDISEMAERQQRHVDQVQRERERHSQPMGIGPVASLVVS
jgi:GGDEF domain-containing protein